MSEEIKKSIVEALKESRLNTELKYYYDPSIDIYMKKEYKYKSYDMIYSYLCEERYEKGRVVSNLDPSDMYVLYGIAMLHVTDIETLYRFLKWYQDWQINVLGHRVTISGLGSSVDLSDKKAIHRLKNSGLIIYNKRESVDKTYIPNLHAGLYMVPDIAYTLLNQAFCKAMKSNVRYPMLPIPQIFGSANCAFVFTSFLESIDMKKVKACSENCIRKGSMSLGIYELNAEVVVKHEEQVNIIGFFEMILSASEGRMDKNNYDEYIARRVMQVGTYLETRVSAGSSTKAYAILVCQDTADIVDFGVRFAKSKYNRYYKNIFFTSEACVRVRPKNFERALLGITGIEEKTSTDGKQVMTLKGIIPGVSEKFF